MGGVADPMHNSPGALQRRSRLSPYGEQLDLLPRGEVLLDRAARRSVWLAAA